MMSNGTVPSWRKHGTVQPSQLHHLLPSPTTDPIHVTKSSFRHLQHFVLVLAAFFFFVTVSFMHFYTLLGAAECFILNKD